MWVIFICLIVASGYSFVFFVTPVLSECSFFIVFLFVNLILITFLFSVNII